MPDTPGKLPDFVHWASFPFEGQLRVKALEPAVANEPPRQDEDASECRACAAPDDNYIWVSERWRVRATDRPTGLPMVLLLESRSHLDLGDLTNMLAAELGVMTVRLERAVRSLDGVARVHVNRWGDGSAHLHLWFFARPYGRLQLRGSFLSAWDDILPPVQESVWRENLALVAAWLADFGGRALAEPPRIEWQAPATLDSSFTFAGSVHGAPVTHQGSGGQAGPAESSPSGGEHDGAQAARNADDPAVAPGGGTVAGETPTRPNAGDHGTAPDHTAPDGTGSDRAGSDRTVRDATPNAGDTASQPRPTASAPAPTSGPTAPTIAHIPVQATGHQSPQDQGFAGLGSPDRNVPVQPRSDQVPGVQRSQGTGLASQSHPPSPAVQPVGTQTSLAPADGSSAAGSPTQSPPGSSDPRPDAAPAQPAASNA